MCLLFSITNYIVVVKWNYNYKLLCLKTYSHYVVITFGLQPWCRGTVWSSLCLMYHTVWERSEARVAHVYYTLDTFAGNHLNKLPQIVEPTTVFFQSKIHRSMKHQPMSNLWSVHKLFSRINKLHQNCWLLYLTVWGPQLSSLKLITQGSVDYCICYSLAAV